MAMSGTHKTNVTSIETAIATALSSLPSVSSDSSVSGAREVLRQMQTLLAQIADVRTQ